jgi:DUF4097 and DUF4098 domain-containing protein YvlB
MKSRYWPFFLLLLVLQGCNMSINKDVKIADGHREASDVMSINGSVRVGDDCQIRGVCRSINGFIRIGDRSQVHEVQTVNGPITIGANTVIRRDVQSINGDIECQQGVIVRGDCDTINGSVELDSAIVHGSINTFNGKIELDHHSQILKNLVIHAKGKSKNHRHNLDIYIKNGSCVNGDVIVKGERLNVTVHTSAGGRVLGQVKNANLQEEPS